MANSCTGADIDGVAAVATPSRMVWVIMLASGSGVLAGGGMTMVGSIMPLLFEFHLVGEDGKNEAKSAWRQGKSYLKIEEVEMCI